MPAKYDLLFVCGVNTKRSVILEALMNEFAKRDGLNHEIQASSAGLTVSEPERPDGEAVNVCRDWGVDISEHRSRPVTPELMKKATHILVMDEDDRRALNDRYPHPQWNEKVFTIGVFSGDFFDIKSARDASFSSRSVYDRMKSFLTSNV